VGYFVYQTFMTRAINRMSCFLTSETLCMCWCAVDGDCDLCFCDTDSSSRAQTEIAIGATVMSVFQLEP